MTIEASDESGAPPSSPRGPSRLVVWVVSIALLAVCASRCWRFIHDDAFIVLRYAEHALHGEGPVWNTGERVEGYTSPLWLIQLIVLGGVGVPLRYAAQILGLGWLLAWCGTHLHGLSGRARSTAWLVVTLGPAVVWAFGGLETASVGALVTASFLAHRRTMRGLSSPWTLAILLGMLALTRPEGLLFVAPVFIERGLRRDGRSIVALCAGSLAPVAAWEIFRWAYYGSWVPNTAHVKIPTDFEGMRSFAGYLRASLPLWLPCLLVVAALRPSRKVVREAAPWLAAGGLYFGYLAFVGGDSMPWGRTLVPLLAVATTLCGLAVGDDLAAPGPGPNRWYRRAVLGAGVLAQAAVLLWTPPQFEDGSARTGTYVGIFLESVLPAGSLVALNSAGATPYYAPSLRFLDMLGLNDAHIARAPVPPIVTELQRLPGHRLGDGRYVVSRNPDAIILGPAHGDTRAWFYGDYELLRDDDFRARYVPVVVDLDFARLRPLAVRTLPPWEGIPGESSVRFEFFVRRGSASEEAVRRLVAVGDRPSGSGARP